jgi:hypothetical protein
MFTTGDYKIVFKKRWHQPREIDAKATPRLACAPGTLANDGRYDTVCEITNLSVHSDWEANHFEGIAVLHPNDRVDRIVGKKIALGRALEVAWPSSLEGEVIRINSGDDAAFEIMKIEAERKLKRKVIWCAFWQWVSQWPNQPVNKT